MGGRLTAGSVVLHTHTGKIALTNQGGLTWSLPKGGVDPGEDILEAAIRETVEETGIPSNKMEMVRKLGVYERTRMNPDGSESGLHPKEIHVFLFETDHDELAPTDPINPEARWVEKSEVAATLSNNKDKQFFESIAGSI